MKKKQKNLFKNLSSRISCFTTRPKLEKSNNGAFWISKISRNRERDDEINKRLLFEGWTVIRFWGDEIKKHTDECVKVIEEAIFDIEIGDEET